MSKIRFRRVIRTIASYLNNGEKVSSIIEYGKHFKKQEAEKLENYIAEKNLLVKNIDFSQS